MYPDVNKLVRKGEIIARIKNMFGNVVDEYFSPCTGVVSVRSSYYIISFLNTYIPCRSLDVVQIQLPCRGIV